MLSLKPEVPLTDEPVSAVLARVAFAVAVYRYWRPIGRELPDPATYTLQLAEQLSMEGWNVLSGWTLSMAYHGSKGIHAARWRNIVVQRARQAQRNRQAGKPWQRVPPCY